MAAHTLSSRLTQRERMASPIAMALTGLVLGLLACALPFALRLALLVVRADSWPAYVLLGVVVLGLLVVLTEVNYFGRAWYLTLLYAVAAGLLTATGWWWGHTADVLDARGRWTEVTVVKVTERTKRQALCTLQRAGDGSRVSRPLDDCADLTLGDRLAVLEDPEGEVRPQRSAPSVFNTYVSSGVEATLLLATTTGAFWVGSRRRRLPAPPPYPPSTVPQTST
ncbi:hypothetical protein [Streptomyces sp. TRM68416]|uniref:hypothetical protein n=1 Tax=Streptomyces sp. TRM68416 TaxID=2758412 RepID=UPI00166198F7|nr:hypothetical protein [Streptomyces sp. TRM68416]MBD0842751.1 hypothetical protein [Streptomyces sp. TRM68416]